MTALNPRQPEQQEADAAETQEWIDALASVIEYEGKARAEFLVAQLMQQLSAVGGKLTINTLNRYLNSFSEDLPYPGALS